MTAEATLCPSCRREKQTIRGLGPHCGHAKGRVRARRYDKIASGDFWGDLDDLFFFSLMVAPGLALLIIALVFVASDLLLLAALALLIAPFVARLVSD